MFGPTILVRAMSQAVEGSPNGKPFAYGRAWQYHPRSDRHSKIACWGVLFDLLLECRALQRQARDGLVGFGINHEMRDFARNRKKNLDLVVCRRSAPRPRARTFVQLAEDYGVPLDASELEALHALPVVHEVSTTSVMLALEAKACMTAHGKARPRLYDELSSSHAMIHGDTDDAIAAGLAIVNAAPTFVSPLKNPWPTGERADVATSHKQPGDTASVIEKLEELPRRSRSGEPGYDAFGIVVVSCANDGTPCSLVTGSPAPASNDIYEYGQFVRRIAQIYATRFGAT